MSLDGKLAVTASPTPMPALPKSVELSAEDAVSMVREMATIREFEMCCKGFYEDKIVRGFLHLQEGQEAVPVGTVMAMREGDSYSGSYRIHGWHYMVTKNIVSTIGEVAGKAIGCSKGKGGSMHLYAPAQGLYGGQGIVGAQVPIGAGLAFAAAYLHDKPQFATVALFGDGALNQGQVAETFNLAALYKLPLILCLEDNHYSMGTSVARGSAEKRLSQRFPFVSQISVDGMDVAAVYAAMRYAREYVMSGVGPIGVHIDTYRYSNHSASDSGSYRSKDEVATMRKERDAILTFAERVSAMVPSLSARLQQVQEEAITKVAEARDEVLAAAAPPMSELTTDIYIGPSGPVRSCQSTQYI